MRSRSAEIPRDTRYARAVTARRSPNARLYSAVPRSSQCPSMVTAQVGYFFSTAAFSSSVFCAAPESWLLSNSNITGFSSELRLRSSSDADAIVSSRTGSDGTMVGSLTGSGGDGGRPVGEDGGGGIGRATGPGFLWQAATLISTTHKDKLIARRNRVRRAVVTAV